MPSSDVILAVQSRWALGKKLGAGGFADVYQATDMKTGNIVAIKLEKASTRFSRLSQEYEAYRQIHDSSKKVVGFPNIHLYKQASRYNVLVMDCLGSSLEDLVLSKKRLALKTVLNYGLQALRHLRFMHHKSFVHCDVKPDNMMLDRYDSKKLYMADLGLAKKYRDSETLDHIPMSSGNAFVGTPSFASMNAHRGVELSRRDDLESLGYVLVYLYKGELPWNATGDESSAPWAVGKPAGGKERNEEILSMKESIPVYELCEGMPGGVMEFLAYVRKLGFDERPDYGYLQGLLEKEVRNASWIKLSR